jgi:hypothetical protein
MTVSGWCVSRGRKYKLLLELLVKYITAGSGIALCLRSHHIIIWRISPPCFSLWATISGDYFSQAGIEARVGMDGVCMLSFAALKPVCSEIGTTAVLLRQITCAPCKSVIG